MCRAIWHGFHYAYFYAFGLEFFTMLAERNSMKWASGIIDYVWSVACPRPLFYILCLMQWILRTFLVCEAHGSLCTMYTSSDPLCPPQLANGVLAFDLLKVSEGYAVQKSVYFIPHLIVLAMIALPPVCTGMDRLRRNYGHAWIMLSVLQL